MSLFGKMQQIKDEESKAETPVEEPVQDPVAESEVDPVVAEDPELESEADEQEPEPEPVQSHVAQFLKSKGILEEGDDQALMSKIWNRLEQQSQELAYYRQQVQQPQKTETKPESAEQEQPKSTLPRYDRNWSTWVDADGSLKETAPTDVRDAYRQVQEFEQLRMTDPNTYYNRVFREAVDTGYLKEVIEPMIQEMVGGQIQRTEQERQIQSLQKEIESKLVMMSDTGEMYFDASQNPVYNDLGKRVMPMAYEIMEASGVDANSDPYRALQIVNKVIRMLEQQQPTTPPPKKPTLQEKRKADQEKLNLTNRLRSVEDPGGDRNGNSAHGVPHTHVPNNRQHYVPSFRERLADFKQNQLS